MEKKEKVRYQGISLPIPFIEAIKKHIGNTKGLRDTYRGVPDYVATAVREKMVRDNLFVGTTIDMFKAGETQQLDDNLDVLFERYMEDKFKEHMEKKLKEKLD